MSDLRWWRVRFDLMKNEGKRAWCGRRQSMYNFHLISAKQNVSFMSMPEALYPTMQDLPTHRRKIDLYPELTRRGNNGPTHKANNMLRR